MVNLDNADKLFFPAAGLTKGDLARYYRRIAPRMLPHVARRPLTLNRFPDGVDGVQFLQKAAASHYPDWLARVTVPKEDGELSQPLAGTADALVYLAGQGAIEFHVPLARKDALDYPDRLIFDLDPLGEAGEFASVIAAARAIRDALHAVELNAFVMTSGSSGLHVTVPLDRHTDINTVRGFAQTIAQSVADAHPERFTTAHAIDKRHGRVYLDIRRNAFNQTAVAPYSVRARARAPIATPLDWDELSRPGMGPQRYRIDNIFRRLAQRDCPWIGLDKRGQSLGPASRKLHNK